MRKNTVENTKRKKEYLDNLGYPVGDFLIRLKNCALARNKVVEFRATRLVEAVAKALKEMGYVSDISKEGHELKVSLAYKNKAPVLSDVILVSKPSRRVYLSSDEIKKEKSPYIMLLTTTYGVISSTQAIKKNVGGEVIARIL